MHVSFLFCFFSQYVLFFLSLFKILLYFSLLLFVLSKGMFFGSDALCFCSVSGLPRITTLILIKG